MNVLVRFGPALALGLLALLGAGSAVAEDELSAGDTAWMMTSSALVLMMTLPGLALFYGGLVRSRNVLSILMQCLISAGLMGVLWVVAGYSLAFSGDGSFIGDLDKLLLKGIGPDTLSGTIPEYVFVMFQGMFAIITPALMIGAFAERMRFGPFAGGLVVHMSSGFSALVAALFLGKRRGYGKDPMPPHSLPLTVIGAALLWVGWFGFNAGSALAADGVAGLAFLTTNTATASAVLGWVAIEWLHRGKPTVLGAATAAVAGLVAITPACAFVTPGGAILIGLGASGFCYFAVTLLKPLAGYDDSLDVFGVHGIGGTWGAIATGLFIADFALPEGVSWGAQLAAQLQSVLLTAVFAKAPTTTRPAGLRRVESDAPRKLPGGAVTVWAT
jgi:Amt family ammonium transporter